MTVTLDVSSIGRTLVAAVFVGVGIGIIALIFGKIRHFIASRRFEQFDREGFRRRWLEIEALLDASGEVSRKLAVLEADKLLDQALKSLAMPGTSLGDRLKFATYKHPELRNVWWAHKVRNQLAHEATYHLDAALAKKAVRTFKAALERLGAI